MAVFQHSKLEVWSRILFFSFAIIRCQNCNIESSTFLDVMYSHWEQCREVIEESVVCESHHRFVSVNIFIYMLYFKRSFAHNVVLKTVLHYF